MIEFIKESKPLLSSKGQIAHLKSKGIQFELISEDEAENYLVENNNYFKLRAFRKNFEKYKGGANDDTYINLDFAMLKDLAIIDMRLRYALILFVLDIEHFEKVKLLTHITINGDDGYTIVDKYFEKLKEIEEDESENRPYSRLLSEIKRNDKNEYCGGIISKYNSQYPVWAFIEIIPFGEFISFLRFCAEYFEDKELMNDSYLLKDVKRLRNAIAHNNCILNNLRLNTAKQKTNYNVSAFLGKLGIPKNVASKRMSNAAIRDIVTVLYTHRHIVKSNGVKTAQFNNLKTVIERCFLHQEYYKKNDLIMSTFSFLKIIVDKMDQL